MKKENIGLMSNAKSIAGLATIANASRASSLLDVSNAARVEPNCLISSDIANMPYVDDIMQSALNSFCGIYSLAFHLTAPIDGINIIKRLDSLNPNRKVGDSVLTSDWYSQEESAYDSTFGALNPSEMQSPYATQEASGGNPKALTEVNDLSVGKMLSLSVPGEGASVDVPVAIRLRTTMLKASVAPDIMLLDANSKDWSETQHLVRSGRLSFISDIIFARSFIKNHQKNLMNDDSGLYKAKADRKRNNKLAGILSGRPSLATVSDIAIISHDVARQIEKKGRGRFTDQAFVNKVMDTASVMIMMIVDTEWEAVEVYYMGIDRPTEVTINQMQRSAKKSSGDDILKVMTALNEKKAPLI